MNSIFNPLTFGYEWETMLVTQELGFCKKDIIQSFARLMQKELNMPVGCDFASRDVLLLEIRSSILNNLEKLIKSVDAQVEYVRKNCKEKNILFFPCGTHPLLGNPVGLHIHLGSIYNHPEATKLANALIKYAPCFSAISVNSPVVYKALDTFKSSRVAKYASHCSRVRVVQNPKFAQFTWGDDVCVKVDWYSTIELRIPDCPSSIQFLKEFIAFVVAFVLNTPPETEELSYNQYREYIINRFYSAKYGLQAKFLWDGEFVPVTCILKNMLESIDFGELGKFKFKLIPIMIEKRLTQADWQMELYDSIKDPFAFTDIFVKALQDGDPFYEWILEEDTELPVIEPVKIEDYILQHIGRETPYIAIQELLLLPYYEVDKYLAKLKETHKIKEEKDPKYGRRFSTR